MAASDRSRPWRLRRLVQFRLRSMLILMTLTAVGLAVYRGYAVPYRQQHEAGKALVAKGATLEWRPLQPAWLVKVLSLAIDEVVLQDCIAVHGEYSQIVDKDMPNLRHMPRLERLYLAGTKVTDEGLRHVEGLEYLRRLSLWDTRITDEGLRPVGRLRALEALDIHQVASTFVLGSRAWGDKLALAHSPRNSRGKLTTKCLTHLIDTPELRELFFSFPVDDEALLHLGRCRHLRLKTLMLQGVTEVGMSQLPTFPDLEKLVILQADVGEDGVAHLAALPKLRWLSMIGEQGEPGRWKALGGLSQLEKLVMINCSIDDEGYQGIARLERLESLALECPTANDANVACLARMPNLLELQLGGGEVSSDALRELKNLPRLSKLAIGGDFDDEAVRWLLEMKSLVELRAQRFYLSDAGLADLARLRVIRSVRVFDAKAGAGLRGIDVEQGAGVITNEGLTQLWASPTLKYVTLTGEAITDIGSPQIPKTRRMDSFTLVSPRPLSELITHRLETGSRTATFSPQTLSFSGHKPGFPKRLTFSYTGDAYPLAVLQHVPTITGLHFGVDRQQEVAQCNWDNLRYVPGLTVFKMTAHSASALRIDGIGIRRLGEMKGLLHLECCISDDVSADDLAVLGDLQELNSVTLIGSRFDRDCLRILGQLKNLRILRIIQPARPGDEPLGVSYLSQLKKLEVIELHGATKEDMTPLAKITSLREVALKNHQISDKDLEVLAGLPQLKSLRPGGSMSGNRYMSLQKVFSPRVAIWSN